MRSWLGDRCTRGGYSTTPRKSWNSFFFDETGFLTMFRKDGRYHFQVSNALSAI